MKIFAAALLASLLTSSLSPAATVSWTAPSSVNLAGSANWSTGSPPTSSDEVLFENVPQTTLSTGNTLNWGDLIWNTNSSATIQIASSQSANKVLTLGGAAAGAAAIAAGGAANDLIVLGDNVTTGTLTISGATVDGHRLRVSVNADGNFNVKNAGATLVIASDFYQADVNLTKTGQGTLTIGASTNFSADHTFAIAAGTVNANNASALGAGNVALEDGTLTVNEADVGAIALKADKTFTMSSGTLSLSFASPASYDQITGSGTGTFSLTGGIIDLNNSITDYSVAYTVLQGFASGSVSGITFINYDNADYLAHLDDHGVLSFSANSIPEPSTYAALLGGLALAFVALNRRRS